MSARWSVLLGLILLGGCSGHQLVLQESEELGELRGTGYRIAVLPFALETEGEGWVASTLTPVGNVLAFEGFTDGAPTAAESATFLRRAFVASLCGRAFEVLDLATTDARLTSSGLAIEAILDRERAGDVAHRLGVDGLVYGRVLAWDRSYYVLESTQSVALRVELVDAESRAVLLASERTARRNGGLTGGPTGQISVATEPIAALKSSTRLALARDVAREAAKDLVGRAQPPSGRLEILSARIVSTGLAELEVGDVLEVEAIATAGADLRFDVGQGVRGMPMLEVEHPVRGGRSRYVGRWLVEGELGPEARVTVQIAAGAGGPAAERRRLD